MPGPGRSPPAPSQHAAPSRDHSRLLSSSGQIFGVPPFDRTARELRRELEKKNIKYESGTQGEFTIGLNILGKDGWELIQVNMFNPSRIPNPPLQSIKKDDYDVEIFYFKREIK